MLWNEIVSSICICISSLIFGSSLLRESKKNIISVQILSSLLYVGSYIFAYLSNTNVMGGIIIATIEIVRLLVFYIVESREKWNTNKNILILGVTFALIMIVTNLVFFVNWLTILMVVGGVVVSLGFGSKNITFLKSTFMLQALLTVIYLTLNSLIINAIAQGIVLILSIIGLIVHIKNIRQTHASIDI